MSKETTDKSKISKPPTERIKADDRKERSNLETVTILENLEPFLDNVFKELRKAGIDVSDYELDHIAYQASSNDDYDSLRPKFLEMGELLREELISNRRIAILKLNEPLKYESYEISALELIAPAKGQNVPSGLHHAEFVIDESLRQFMEKYPKIEWLDGAIDKEPYSHLNVILGDIVVKFHTRSIVDIVTSLED